MLTNTEEQIYKLLCENTYSYKELTEVLCISYSTLKTHINNICKKKDIDGCNRAEKLIVDYWKNKEYSYKQQIKKIRKEQIMEKYLITVGSSEFTIPKDNLMMFAWLKSNELPINIPLKTEQQAINFLARLGIEISEVNNDR